MKNEHEYCTCSECEARRADGTRAQDEIRLVFAPHGEEAVSLSNKILALCQDKNRNVHSQAENMVWMRTQFEIAQRMYLAMPHEEVARRLAIVEQMAVCAACNAKRATKLAQSAISMTEINLDKMDPKDAEAIIQNVVNGTHAKFVNEVKGRGGDL